MKTTTTGRHGRGGFTLWELSISMVILVMVSSGIVLTLNLLRKITDTGDVKSRLQGYGDRAITAILDDLGRSGETTIGVSEYPHVFAGGDADAPFDAHDHPQADKSAEPDDPDFGDNQEIVFLLPADVDADEEPDVNANGELVWGAEEISFIVATGADGVNYLERRVDGVLDKRICGHVERIVFDDDESSLFVVPARTVRVRIDFRAVGADRLTYFHSVEATVRLRNGG